MGTITVFQLIFVISSQLILHSHQFPKNSREKFGYVYTSYQEGITCTSPFAPFHPRTLKEIQDLIHFAIKSNLTVKPIGQLHSISDMICTDGIPLNLDAINHFHYDPESGIATIGGGATLSQLVEKLHLLGRGLVGFPTYTGITIGGAIGTGAHGSTLNYPTTLSDQMIGVVAVDGLGNVRNITGGTSLNAFRAHLGLLGVVYEVSFATVAQYKIHMVTDRTSEDILFSRPEQIVGMARSIPFFHFIWFPTSKQVLLAQGRVVPVSTGGDCKMNLFMELPRFMSATIRSLFETIQAGMIDLGAYLIQNIILRTFHQPFIPRTGLFVTNDGANCQNPVGYSHRILTDDCKECGWGQGNASMNMDVFQVAIPVSELGHAIQTLNNIFQDYPVEFYAGGILFRFMTPSSGLLNTNSGRESVAIEWTFPARVDRYTKPKLGLPASQAMLRALVAQHHGRAHWAKNGLYFSSPEMIQFQHQRNRDKFADLMKMMDPLGIFLNDFGRRIRFSEHKMSLDAREKHCALSDHCTCYSDTDCGGGHPGEYKCGRVMGYNVCKEDFNAVGRGGRLLSRTVINKIQMVQSAALNVNKFLSSFGSG